MDRRTLWIQDGDIQGRIESGSVVTAARTLNDWCLRADDGGEPVAAGALLEIVDVRPWGAAMAQELPELSTDESERDAIMQAALELQELGLFEIVTEDAPECAPSGEIVTRQRDTQLVYGS